MNLSNNESNEPSFWRRPAGMALVTVALIAGFYLLREHWGQFWVTGLTCCCSLVR